MSNIVMENINMQLIIFLNGFFPLSFIILAKEGTTI